MIAPNFVPTLPPQRRKRTVRHAAREATRLRKAYRRKRNYAGPIRLIAVSLLAIVTVVGFLGLLQIKFSLEAQSISNEAKRAKLTEVNLALSDRVAALQSRDRLFGIANRLGMHEAKSYVIVNVPAPVVTPEPSMPLLGAVMDKLHLR